MNQPNILSVFPDQLSTCWLESPVVHTPTRTDLQPAARFNLTDNLFELKNLLNDPAQQNHVTALLDDLRQWAAMSGSPPKRMIFTHDCQRLKF